MADPNFEALRIKYRPVLDRIKEVGAQLRTLEVESGKLLIRAEAPSEEARGRIWDEIKQADPSVSDLTADITVPGRSGGTLESTARLYTVQPGDTLRSIAAVFYGDEGQFGKILQANREHVGDPDQLRPGQRLAIPDGK